MTWIALRNDNFFPGFFSQRWLVMLLGYDIETFFPAVFFSLGVYEGIDFNSIAMDMAELQGSFRTDCMHSDRHSDK